MGDETKYFDQNRSRLAALHGLAVLDSGSEKIYEDITQLTADICEVPVCLISLIDTDRHWFKAGVGLDVDETYFPNIEQSICSYAIEEAQFLEVPDTSLDPRTIGNALCQGDKPFRFYAGAILRTLDGWPLGTLCVLDYKPRKLTAIQRRTLEVNGNSVTRQLELTNILIDRANRLKGEAEPDSLFTQNLHRNETARAHFATLTPRETEVLALIAGQNKSLSSKEIARELGISFRTVHHYRSNVMTKMDVASVAELITVTIKAGLFN